MRFAVLALATTALLSPLLSGAEIPQGAHMLLRMVNSVTTRTARPGDRVYMRTATPIIVDGQFLVPVDSYVEGTVARSVRSGRVKGRAELGLRIETIILPSGKSIKASPHLNSVDSGGTEQKVNSNEGEIKQGGTVGKDVERGAIIAAQGALTGAIVDQEWRGAGIGAGAGSAVGLAAALISRGKEVELAAGSTFDVVFDRAVPIN